MPHLRLEYPKNLNEIVDMADFADHMRRTLLDCQIFPRAGIRVRGLPCEPVSVADGGDHHFLHMEVMIGTGRTKDEKEAAVAQIYDAAEAYLRPILERRTFALSLEMRELSAFNRKSWNTIRSQIGD